MFSEASVSGVYDSNAFSNRGNRPSVDPGRPRQGVCRLFAQNKTCKYGRGCRFSHSDSSTGTESSGEHKPAAYDDRVSQFKRLVNQSGKANRFSRDTSTQSVFALGLEILDNVKDAGLKQEVVTALASEEGLSCIRHVAANRIPLAMAGSTDAKFKLWETEVCPLFRLVIHNTV